MDATGSIRDVDFKIKDKAEAGELANTCHHQETA